MKNFLSMVMEERRRDARAVLTQAPLQQLQQQALAALAAPPRRSFIKTCRRLRAQGSTPAIIAELKRASPTAGRLRLDYQPAALAAEYARAGAAAISVLTEPRHFLGCAADLQQVRQTVDLPLLRKDFISEPYQVIESAVLGADMVLLIAAALDFATLKALASLAAQLGLEALVEVHNQAELDKAATLPGVILGVNSRDLISLRTDLALARRLAPALPVDRMVIAESGIRSPQDVEELGALGYQGFLVGETLMRAGDVGAQLRALLGSYRAAPAGLAEDS